jgi:hypothetical protein
METERSNGARINSAKCSENSARALGDVGEARSRWHPTRLLVGLGRGIGVFRCQAGLPQQGQD